VRESGGARCIGGLPNGSPQCPADPPLPETIRIEVALQHASETAPGNGLFPAPGRRAGVTVGHLFSLSVLHGPHAQENRYTPAFPSLHHTLRNPRTPQQRRQNQTLSSEEGVRNLFFAVQLPTRAKR